MNSRIRKRKREIIAARDGDHCHWCQHPFAPDDLRTLDHVTPRSQRGRNALHNLVLACEPCNRARGDQGAL
jgi:5-methylcytosine-specific restriction endonuclease McrA